MASSHLSASLRRIARRARLRRSSAPAVPAVPDDVVALVKTARWLDDDRYEVTGWVYRKGVPATAQQRPRLELFLADGADTATPLPVEPVHDPAIDAAAGDPDHEYAHAGFRTVVDLAALREPGRELPRLQLRYRLRGDDLDVSGPMTAREAGGGASQLLARGVQAGEGVRPRWSKSAGLTFVRQPARAELRDVRTASDGVELTVHAPGAVSASLVGRDSTAEVALAVDATDEGLRVRVPTGLGGLGDAAIADLIVGGPDGEGVPVLWASTLRDSTHQPVGADPAVVLAPSGIVRVDTAPAVAIARVAFADAAGTRLRVQLHANGVDLRACAITLEGPRLGVPGIVVDEAGATAEIELTLTAARWGETEARPLPLGTYTLAVTSADGRTVTPRFAAGAVPTLPVRADDRPGLAVRRGGDGELRVRIAAPLAPGEDGKRAQAVLRRAYQASASSAPVEDAVYLESFYGRNATDSVRAIDDELVRRKTSLTRYWGVTDPSVAVPDGAVPVVVRSREWWDLMGRVRYHVTNCWTTNDLRPTPEQRVVQTWHGTPFKLLGNDRPSNQRDPQYAERTRRQTALWDVLLAGNPYSAEIFARTYLYEGELLDLGYPRNDALATAPPERAVAVREALGVADGRTVVLYAPTWREGVGTLVQLLDLEYLAERLGDDYVFLLRGHTNTLARSGSVTGRNVVDVSDYPEINDLFLAADVMVTDYSSVMFDYSVTRKPMLFLVPDLADYRDRGRGVYFDLAETAPGPLLTDSAQVADSLERLDEVRATYQSRYDAWVATYNPYDDGAASARVVDAIFGARA